MAPRREGMGCQPTSFSSFWEADDKAGTRKARNTKDGDRVSRIYIEFVRYSRFYCVGFGIN